MADRKTELLEAIRTSDEDQPRLIYADWLEERGELAHANLIRRQCDVAAHPAWDRRAIEARWEVEHLLAHNEEAWRAELPELEGVQWLDFERGFVTHVKVANPATLYANGDEIRDASPVTKVTLGAIDEIDAPLPIGGIPWLRTLRLLHHDTKRKHPTRSLLDATSDLEIDHVYYDCSAVIANRKKPLVRFAVDDEHPIGGSLVTRLSALGFVAAGLRELRLGTKWVDNDTGYYDDPTVRFDGANTLAAMNLVKLEILDLARQRITSTGLEALMPTLPRLRELDVSGCELGTLAPLFHDGASLVHLNADNNTLNDSGANPIWSAPRTAALESLSLDTCELGPYAIAELTQSPLWQTLRVLDLSRNPIGIEGARALAAASRPAHLHTLRVADCDFDDDAADVIASCAWLDQLIELDLSSNRFSPDLLRRLNVRVLSLLQATPTSDPKGSLENLWPHAVKVTLDGLALAGLLPDTAPELQELSLADCEITLADLQQVLPLPKLRSLDLSGGDFDKEEVVNYLAKHGAGSVVVLDLRRIQFGLPDLLTLARSEPLSHVDFKLHGQPWDFPGPARTELEERFGKDWYYHHDDPDEDEDEEADEEE